MSRRWIIWSPSDSCGPVAADDVRRRPVQQHRPGGLVRVQRADQLAGQVLGPGQRAQRRRPEQRGGRRVGAEEARRRRADHAVHDEVVQRHVVAAEPPAPRPRAARLAEHPQVVHQRIAAPFPPPVDPPALDLVQHVVQPDDGGHGVVPGDGQPGRDELVGQPLLGRPLGAEGQPAVVGGGVEPAPALGVGLRVRAGRAAAWPRPAAPARARPARPPRRRPSGSRPPGPLPPGWWSSRSYPRGLLPSGPALPAQVSAHAQASLQDRSRRGSSDDRTAGHGDDHGRRRGRPAEPAGEAQRPRQRDVRRPDHGGRAAQGRTRRPGRRAVRRGARLLRGPGLRRVPGDAGRRAAQPAGRPAPGRRARPGPPGSAPRTSGPSCPSRSSRR